METPQGETSRANLVEDRTDDAKRKLDAIEIATEKLTRKMFDLELLEVMARGTGVNLRKKEKEVAEQKRKVEELQYQKWARMNDFCDRIWKFSAKNDLSNLLNKYLDMPKRTNCQSVAIDKELHPEFLKLRCEVDELKKRLANKKAHTLSLEEKVLQAKIQLQISESYREKDPEIVRLMKDIEKYQDEVATLEIKIQATEDEKSRKRSQPFLSPIPITGNKDHFVTASELIAQDEYKYFVKKSKFSVKRKSAVSRKLADIRGNRPT